MARERKVYAGAAGRFDEHRNTSRVFGVPPDALPKAKGALAAFRKADPALYAWIAEGAPRLTEAEHLERFGEPYRQTRLRPVGEEPPAGASAPL